MARQERTGRSSRTLVDCRRAADCRKVVVRNQRLSCAATGRGSTAGDVVQPGEEHHQADAREDGDVPLGAGQQRGEGAQDAHGEELLHIVEQQLPVAARGPAGTPALAGQDA
ncbi:hypothetical protein SHKM778_36670 [Streptomyces sp. KM77-8]|uniref:Uncharacterized protein n=1 Tax=Streptomyces haneummycinicus TaxID=3074435 RepID=A0AAT9HJ32_9ACTN